MKDIFAYKQAELYKCVGQTAGSRGRVGLPLALCMYEQLPLWAGFFGCLGFEVVLSEKSACNLKDRYFYDTACYPAKLMCSHIENLSDKGAEFIFLPCESFNSCADNNDNCPYTAYYPELLRVENDRLTANNFITPYIDLNSKKRTAITLFETFKNFGLKRREVSSALKEGFIRLDNYEKFVCAKSNEILAEAREEGRRVIILAGRPYHVDIDINHGINKFLTSLGFAVLSDEVVTLTSQLPYRTRLYKTAEFAVKNENVSLAQLISKGCKFDEIISDQVRAILENNGKPYTRIVLDEATNTDTVKTQLLNLLK